MKQCRPLQVARSFPINWHTGLHVFMNRSVRKRRRTKIKDPRGVEGQEPVRDKSCEQSAPNLTHQQRAVTTLLGYKSRSCQKLEEAGMLWAWYPAMMRSGRFLLTHLLVPSVGGGASCRARCTRAVHVQTCKHANHTARKMKSCA